MSHRQHSEVHNCFNWTDCFDQNYKERNIIQKIRVCREGQYDLPFLLLTATVLVTGILSIFAQYRLNRLVEYKNLFEASKSFCCVSCPWFSCCLKSMQAPIVHRSLIFTLIKNYSDVRAATELRNFFESLDVNNEVFANRPLEGNTPVIFAVENNKPTCLRILLANGACIVHNMKHEYPLNIAVKNGNLEITKILLVENTSEILQDINTQEYPLNIAVKNENIEITKLLLEHKAEIKNDIKTSKYPLNIAVEAGNFEITKCLLEKKAEIKKDVHTKKYPLNIAVEAENVAITKLLLEYKAEIRSDVDKYSKYPLNFAVEAENFEITKLLLENNAKIKKGFDSQKYPLNFAVEAGNFAITKILLDYKAEIKNDTDTSTYPLNVAIRNQNIGIAALLFQNGAEIKTDSGGILYTFHSVKSINPDMIKSFFLEVKENPLPIILKRWDDFQAKAAEKLKT